MKAVVLVSNEHDHVRPGLSIRLRANPGSPERIRAFRSLARDAPLSTGCLPAVEENRQTFSWYRRCAGHSLKWDIDRIALQILGHLRQPCEEIFDTGRAR
jgi:hypothetical protein